MTQTVKLLTRYSSPRGQIAAGATARFSDSEAEQLIAGGYAEPVSLSEVDSAEVATVESLDNQQDDEQVIELTANEPRTGTAGDENRGGNDSNPPNVIDIETVKLADIPDFPETALPLLKERSVTAVGELGRWIRDNGQLTTINGIGDKTATKIINAIDGFVKQQQKSPDA